MTNTELAERIAERVGWKRVKGPAWEEREIWSNTGGDTPHGYFVDIWEYECFQPQKMVEIMEAMAKRGEPMTLWYDPLKTAWGCSVGHTNQVFSEDKSPMLAVAHAAARAMEESK